jgi:hypothetical protein
MRHPGCQLKVVLMFSSILLIYYVCGSRVKNCSIVLLLYYTTLPVSECSNYNDWAIIFVRIDNNIRCSIE